MRRVLDIGCGHGGVLAELRRRLAVEVVGVDLRPPAGGDVEIVRADAVRDALPKADIAFSLCMGRHLSEEELAGMIRNVGRSCRRFLLIDLVRHPLPLALFRAFVVPIFSHIAAADGIASIRRAYTTAEFARIADRAVRALGVAHLRQPDARHRIPRLHFEVVGRFCYTGTIEIVFGAVRFFFASV